MLGQVAERVLAHLPFVIKEEFAAVALRQGKFGYSLVRQGVVVVPDLYVLGFCHCQLFLQRYVFLVEKV